jgi:hypothetical protein
LVALSGAPTSAPASDITLLIPGPRLLAPPSTARIPAAFRKSRTSLPQILIPSSQCVAATEALWRLSVRLALSQISSVMVLCGSAGFTLSAEPWNACSCKKLRKHNETLHFRFRTPFDVYTGPENVVLSFLGRSSSDFLLPTTPLFLRRGFGRWPSQNLLAVQKEDIMKNNMQRFVAIVGIGFALLMPINMAFADADSEKRRLRNPNPSKN